MERVRETIREYKESGATELDLSFNQLSEVPKELCQLTALTKLSLYFNKLSEVPKELGQLTALTLLNLSSNQLSEVPKELGQLTALTQLYLDSNQLSEVPKELGQLTALKELNLSSNKLSEVPKELGQLTALTILYLYFNKLSEVPKELGQLTALTILDLSSNQLSEVPKELCQLTALTKLDLSSNKLSEVPKELCQLTALTLLNLSSNQLSEVPKELGQLTALTQLYIHSNQLSEVPKELGQLTALTILYLSFNQLSEVPKELGQLTALTFLDLSSNQLSEVPKELGQLTALKELNLSSNQLSDLPQSLHTATALTKIFLRNNSFTCVPPVLMMIKPSVSVDISGNSIPHTEMNAFSQRHHSELSSDVIQSKVERIDREGRARPRRQLIVVLGAGRVGKTTLLKRLRNLPFDASEPSTLYLARHLLLTARGQPWLANGAPNSLVQAAPASQEHASLTVTPHARPDERADSVTPDERVGPVALRRVKERDPFISLDYVRGKADTENFVKAFLGTRGRQLKQEAESQLNSMSREQKILTMYAQGGSGTLVVHDFAGQDEYAVLQTLFVVPHALYAVVFNVAEFLDAEDDTLLQVLRPIQKWLSTARMRAPHARVLLIGTQLDAVPSERRAALVKEVSAVIGSVIAPSWEAARVLVPAEFPSLAALKLAEEAEVPVFFPITANTAAMGGHTSAFERSLTWIRDEMTRLAFAEIERLPEVSLWWLRLQDALARQEAVVMRRSEVLALANRTDAGDLNECLVYLVRVGAVLYEGRRSRALEDVVFTNVPRLVEHLSTAFSRLSSTAALHMTLKERDTIMAEVLGDSTLVPAYVALMEVYGFMHTHVHTRGTVEYSGFLVPCTLSDTALLKSVAPRVVTSNPWLDNAALARFAVLDVYSDYMDTRDRLFRAVPVGLFHQLVVRLLVRAKECDFMTSAATERACLVAVDGAYLVLESHPVSRCVVIRVSGSMSAVKARQQVESVAEEVRQLLRDYWHLIDDETRENRLVEVGPVCGCVHDLSQPLLDDGHVHMAPVAKTKEMWAAQCQQEDAMCKAALNVRLRKEAVAVKERPVATSSLAWWWTDDAMAAAVVMEPPSLSTAICANGAATSIAKPYSRAAALVVGVSEYKTSANAHLKAWPDLPGVRNSVKLMEMMWRDRNFCVERLMDNVTFSAVTNASRALLNAVGAGAGHDTLLVVHLIGHGAEDGVGGLLLSDAKPNSDGRLSRFDLASLRAALTSLSGWRACNILVIADFCNSGSLLRAEHDLSMSMAAPMSGFARQIITSSLAGASGYMTVDGTKTRVTELIQDALGHNQRAFASGVDMITAVQLRRWLVNADQSQTFSGMKVGRIWDDWEGTSNDGDILLYRAGNGCVQTP